MTNHHQNERPVQILLVEDSPSDARLTIEALSEGRVINGVHHVSDGEAALEFLRRQNDYRDAPRPDLVLLDLNLPRMSGLEVLREIRADEVLRRTPVVILTTSKDERDVLEAYGLSANLYIQKPVDLDQFIDVVRMIDSFFFKVVTLPPR